MSPSPGPSSNARGSGWWPADEAVCLSGLTGLYGEIQSLRSLQPPALCVSALI